MHDKNTSGLQVVAKEDKEPRVKAFIEQHIETLKSQSAADPIEYLLVARSPESPVCRALSSLAAELADQEIAVRIVFTAIDAGAFQGDLAATADLLQMSSCRIVCDSRLYEAHEQLVLDAQTCWIGDCMRREPAKRDAFECFATTAEETAYAATASFSHLWGAGSPTVPVSRFVPSVGFKDAHDAGVLSHAFPGGDSASPTALTRH